MRPAPWAFWASCALLTCVVGCTSAGSGHGGLDGWTRQPLEHAHFFQLWKKGDVTVLLTFGPGGEQDTTGSVLIGEKAEDDVPVGAFRVHSPVNRIALSSTTQSAFLELLGQEALIAGCAHADMLLQGSLRARVDSGDLIELAGGDGIDRERLALLHADLLFTDPFTAASGALPASSMAQCVVSEYLEPHPLGRAEWLKAFGAVLGVEHAADSLYAAMARRYEHAAARVKDDPVRPVVFFGSSWRGVWSVPSGNSYMARLIADAGGDYLFADTVARGNLDIDMETVILKGRRADLWGRILYQQLPVTLEDVAGGEKRVMSLPAFKAHGAFYANSAESDLFGRAVLEPDVQLRDLIGIFHPKLENGRKPVYFKPVQ